MCVCVHICTWNSPSPGKGTSWPAREGPSFPNWVGGKGSTGHSTLPLPCPHAPGIFDFHSQGSGAMRVTVRASRRGSFLTAGVFLKSQCAAVSACQQLAVPRGLQLTRAQALDSERAGLTSQLLAGAGGLSLSSHAGDCPLLHLGHCGQLQMGRGRGARSPHSQHSEFFGTPRSFPSCLEFRDMVLLLTHPCSTPFPPPSP